MKSATYTRRIKNSREIVGVSTVTFGSKNEPTPPRPLYLLTPVVDSPFGLTSLADQQLAGLIMWIPMDLLLFAVALTLFAAALAPADNSVEVNGPNPTVCAVAEGE